jgi:hypothetical protein
MPANGYFRLIMFFIVFSSLLACSGESPLKPINGGEPQDTTNNGNEPQDTTSNGEKPDTTQETVYPEILPLAQGASWLYDFIYDY